MTPAIPTRRAIVVLAAAAAASAPVGAARADSAREIDAKVDLALEELFATVPGTRDLAAAAKGVLVLPDVVKGGLIVGGAFGEGALRVNGATAEYYSFAAASFGFQAGVQSTKQALFFMTDAALASFRGAQGWEAGVDAEVTFPGDGLQAGIDTTNARNPVLGFVFGQDGLMAGASIEGGKYTRVAR